MSVSRSLAFPLLDARPFFLLFGAPPARFPRGLLGLSVVRSDRPHRYDEGDEATEMVTEAPKHIIINYQYTVGVSVGLPGVQYRTVTPPGSFEPSRPCHDVLVAVDAEAGRTDLW